MKELDCYESFARGNVNKNEMVKIRIFTHELIDGFIIEQINNNAIL